VFYRRLSEKIFGQSFSREAVGRKNLAMKTLSSVFLTWEAIMTNIRLLL